VNESKKEEKYKTTGRNKENIITRVPEITSKAISSFKKTIFISF
jgi:hypothetical protein